MITDARQFISDSNVYIVTTYWKGYNEGRAEERQKAFDEKRNAIKQMLIDGVSKDIILRWLSISESEFESLSN